MFQAHHSAAMRVWQASLLATEFDADAKLLLKQLAVGCGGNEVYPKWLGRHATNGLDLLAFQAGRFENHAEESVITALMTAVTSSDRATPPIPANMTDGGFVGLIIILVRSHSSARDFDAEHVRYWG
jgi:hypothetical protein